MQSGQLHYQALHWKPTFSYCWLTLSTRSDIAYIWLLLALLYVDEFYCVGRVAWSNLQK